MVAAPSAVAALDIGSAGLVSSRKASLAIRPKNPISYLPIFGYPIILVVRFVSAQKFSGTEGGAMCRRSVDTYLNLDRSYSLEISKWSCTPDRVSRSANYCIPLSAEHCFV